MAPSPWPATRESGSPIRTARIGTPVGAAKREWLGQPGAVRNGDAVVGGEDMMKTEPVLFCSLNETWTLKMAVPRATVMADMLRTRDLRAAGLLALSRVLVWQSALVVARVMRPRCVASAAIWAPMAQAAKPPTRITPDSSPVTICPRTDQGCAFMPPPPHTPRPAVWLRRMLAEFLTISSSPRRAS